MFDRGQPLLVMERAFCSYSLKRSGVGMRRAGDMVYVLAYRLKVLQLLQEFALLAQGSLHTDIACLPCAWKVELTSTIDASVEQA